MEWTTIIANILVIVKPGPQGYKGNTDLKESAGEDSRNFIHDSVDENTINVS